MASSEHESLLTRSVKGIHRQLDQLTHIGGSVGAFAEMIQETRSIRVYLDNHSYLVPDTSFSHDEAKAPGVVIEVANFQPEANAAAKAKRYLLETKGNVRVAIVLNLAYDKNNAESSSTAASLTMFRVRFITQNGTPGVEVEEVARDEV